MSVWMNENNLIVNSSLVIIFTILLMFLFDNIIFWFTEEAYVY